MKYWIREPGRSDFTGPLSLDEIRTKLLEGSLSRDSEALEASGQSRAALVRSMEWVPLSVICPLETADALSEGGSANALRGQSPQAFLESIRQGTCYSTLREMIGLCAILAISAVVFASAALVIGGFNSDELGPVVVAVVVGVLGCYLVMAGRQASQLFVDIANTLIEQARQREIEQARQREGEAE